LKLKFKHQPFQLDAVSSVVDCFTGQPNARAVFTLNTGRRNEPEQIDVDSYLQLTAEGIGFKNRQIELAERDVLANIRNVQRRNGLKQSEKLEGRYNLTVEMETGTGKTYTYIKTMFELYRTYGWSKFIVVVPSIAIREGVLKSFQMTEDHFMEDYGTKARYFVYNSKYLHHIETFASDSGLNVMIINSQAFSARGKDARRIYMELDDFQSRKPIDVIAGTRPILVIDEPQSVEGKKTAEALKLFNPLFTLRYSATHKKEYNKVYRLDALDAYNKKLVKKIQVKGISVKGSGGSDRYLYLEGIDLSRKRAPVARLEFEVKTKSGLKKKIRKVKSNDDLHQLSGHLEQYRGYVISEIDGLRNAVHFTNGVTLYAGDVQGDVDEHHFRRIQIRETIKSHLEKERKMYHEGIKVLSLFFIDEVAKYRQYDAEGNALNGEYARMFEEEYEAVVSDYLAEFADDPYAAYLRSIHVRHTHKGYFSIDKKSNKLVNPKVTKRQTDSDDASAYDVIMRDKERLLSFAEPTRFIFSHSALKEGWDNPNVFQICTLKHSDSTIQKRQEVGRGLRLCVNRDGERIDATVPGIDVHDINVLTVVASESYEDFARKLQSEMAEMLSGRPRKADVRFFLHKVVENERGEALYIDEQLANKIHRSFIRHGYIDDEDQLTDAYFQAVDNQDVALPGELARHREPFLELVNTIYAEGKVRLVENERAHHVTHLAPNGNFELDAFQKLWRLINRKTVYTVNFDSDELVRKCVQALDRQLTVPVVQYTVKRGDMMRIDSVEQLNQGEAFRIQGTVAAQTYAPSPSRLKYDLVGKLVEETKLTRKTVVNILLGVKESTFHLFRQNPEEFIIRSARLINEQKAAVIVDGITYDVTDQTFDDEVFTRSHVKAHIGHNAYPCEKHVYDYVVTDSKVERDFAAALEASEEVLVYAKLPKGFFIPTPVGEYNPDWAIVLKDRDGYRYVVAETKGSSNAMEWREVEKAKIACARKHFAALNVSQLTYGVVNSYEQLRDMVK